MHKQFLVTFFGLILLSCHQQILVDKSELKQIYTGILTSDSLTDKYYLIDSIESFDKKSIIQSDTTYFIAYCDSTKNGVWTGKLFDNLIIISAGKLHSISKYDQFKMAPIHYSFSLPYFSNDKQTLLIYYNHYCGNLCAEYSLRLYKKINGKWTFIKSYFSMEVDKTATKCICNSMADGINFGCKSFIRFWARRFTLLSIVVIFNISFPIKHFVPTDSLIFPCNRKCFNVVRYKIF